MSQDLPGAPPSEIALTDGAPPDLLAALRDLEVQLVESLSCNPLEAVTLLVAGGGLLFFWAERGRNPKVNTYWDAVHYIATSLSVGYAAIFPETDAGKAIGALVQMVGPSLSSRMLNLPEEPKPSGDALVAEKLDAILAELKRIGGAQ
jgi:hypothetical protein